jgi:anaerobic magnesium-protoporphyrin IX monomethyl ester cyclase
MFIINPPCPVDSVSNKDTMGGLGQLYPAGTAVKMPPIDLPYLVAVMRERNLSCTVLECLGSGMDISSLLLRLKKEKPRVIALRTSLPSLEWDLRVAELINALIGDSEIVLFGPCLKFVGGFALNHFFISAVVIGEAEIVLPELAEKNDTSSIDGLIRRGEEIIASAHGKMVEDLDSLPFPAWDLLPYKSYGHFGLNHTPSVTALTSRGCPHGCGYCPYPVVQGRKMRLRSAENVVEELNWLEKSLGVKSVLFRDPEFAVNRERVIHICEGIIRHSLKILWRCETRIENLDNDLICLMAKAGCIGLNMGIESADSQVLKQSNRKPFPLDLALSLVNCCRRHNVETFCFFILGLPGETWQSGLGTIDYALRLSPTVVQFTAATPYPGTALWEWANSRGYIESESYSSLTGYEAAMRNEYLSAGEITSLRDYACRAWEMKGIRPFIRMAACLGSIKHECLQLQSFIKLRRAIQMNTSHTVKEVIR